MDFCVPKMILTPVSIHPIMIQMMTHLKNGELGGCRGLVSNKESNKNEESMHAHTIVAHELIILKKNVC